MTVKTALEAEYVDAVNHHGREAAFEELSQLFHSERRERQSRDAGKFGEEEYER